MHFLRGMPKNIGLRMRRASLLLASITLIANLSACSTVHRNLIDQEIDSAAEVEKAHATLGCINVILLPGCITKPDSQDTLFQE